MFKIQLLSVRNLFLLYLVILLDFDVRNKVGFTQGFFFFNRCVLGRRTLRIEYTRKAPRSKSHSIKWHSVCTLSGEWWVTEQCCSSRGSQFNFQYPHGSIQPSNSNPTAFNSSSGIYGHQTKWYIDTHGRKTPILIKWNKICFWKGTFGISSVDYC